MAPPTGVVDPGWEHGVALDDRKKKVKCNYCGKIVSGGIYRLKQHLARVSGEVTYCDKSPEDVSLRMKEILQQRCRSSATRKLRHHLEDSYNYGNGQYHEDDDDAEEEEEKRCKGKKQSFSLLRSSGYVDPGWEHGVAQDERKKKVKCNYCGKVVSGGINRFKQHLARIPGEVAPCKAAPEEAYAKIKENMKWHRAGKRQNVPDDGDVRALTAVSQDEEEEEEEYGRYSKDKRRSFVSEGRRPKRVKGSSFMSPPSSSRQIRTYTGCSRREVTSSISKFFHHVGVPLEAANSLYFRKMVELIGMYGEGYVVPSSQLLSGRLLHEEISTIKGHLREYRSSWIITGCSIHADTWTNAEGKTMISFLVSCPRGVYFHSSIDATDVAEDSLSLFKCLDKLVEDIGEENVVQVITQNTGVCRSAGKLLEEKRKNLYWSPCAMHSTELVLEDISKLEYVSECLEKSQRITRFIYSQTWLLNLMKNEFTQGMDLLRQETTRHASSFATLQTLMDHKANLRALFQSNSWILSQTSAAKSEEGREVEKTVSSAAFWKKVQYVLKSVDPVMQVIRMVGGERLSLPYAYGYMCRAKMAIKSIHSDDARKYGPFWRVIDYHWNSLFHHPLYVAAYFFNPAYRYRSDFMAHSEVVRGVNECIVRLEPDNARRITALMQIPDYTSAKGDFGTELAIGTRTELDPAAWWQQHGISCLELQRVAVRILSHTCCSVGCEPKWSVYDQVTGECQSRFARKSRRDAAYVHYNLRLREKQLKRRMHDDDDDEGPPPSSLNYVLLDRLLPDWLVTCEKEEEEGLEDEDRDVEEEENCYEDSGNVYGDGEDNVDVYNDDLSDED
ncbi:HAT dimerization domain-containing protein [Hirschfeldia incana]|nr:HAT dimerization domain-containing protein [Hirschfeldia incana]KAJ0238416.1 HAT dimerization domain-containing protein [Hirschfeldia incana]